MRCATIHHFVSEPPGLAISCDGARVGLFDLGRMESNREVVVVIPFGRPASAAIRHLDDSTAGIVVRDEISRACVN